MAKLIYLGGGFLPRVPARDLSASEAKQYGLAKLLASGLYKEAYKPKPKPEVEAEAEEQED